MKLGGIAIGCAVLLGLVVWAFYPAQRPAPPRNIEEKPTMATTSQKSHCLGYHHFNLPAAFSAMPGQSAELDQFKILRLIGQGQDEAAFLRSQTAIDELGRAIRSWRINGWLAATFEHAGLPDRIVHLVFLQRFGNDMVVAHKSGSISRIGRYEDPVHHRFARDTRLAELTSPTQSGFCVNGLLLSGYRIGLSAQVAAAYRFERDGQEAVLGLDATYDRVDMGRLAIDPVPAGGETEWTDDADIRREPIVWADRTGVLTTVQGVGEDTGWMMGLEFAPAPADPHPPGIKITLDRPPLALDEGRAVLLETLGTFALRAPPW